MPGDNKKRRHNAKEADSLVEKEEVQEKRRMRAYSQDEDNEPSEKRRRTRSVDAQEEEELKRDAAASLTPDEWRKEHSITIQGHGSERGTTQYPDPFFNFSDAPFNDRIQQGFQRAGFDKPTAIQSQSWPIALQGKDLISIAKTGSGKTCGFLLPAFHNHLSKNERVQGYCKPMLLVLAPTRELSVQIMEEAQKFGRPVGIRSVCCYGGASKFPQIGALERGVECVIATPGMCFLCFVICEVACWWAAESNTSLTLPIRPPQ